MKVLYVGSESIQGVKRATGEPYGPFYKMYYLTAVQPVQKDTRVVTGTGYTPKDISVSPEVFQALQSCKPLALLELVVEPDPNNFTRSIIVGVAAEKAV
jgi:hypothetical protein